MRCCICDSETRLFYQDRSNFYKCPTCTTILRHPSSFLNSADEKARYEEHNNDVHDKNYQQFVSPIVCSVLSDFTADDKGLDFGSGTGPVITKLLRDSKYSIQTYDPFFDNNKDVLNQQYNYIACCEVIEHFHNPIKEFTLLKSLLKQKGKLYCMTDLYTDDLNFDKWYYKNDPTHVVFYTKSGLEFIKNNIGFSKLEIQGRLIVLTA